MSYEVSVVSNYHKGEVFPFQLLIFLFTHNYLNTPILVRGKCLFIRINTIESKADHCLMDN